MLSYAELEPDRRGNVLLSWAVRGDGNSTRVQLRAAYAVAKHVRTILAFSGGAPNPSPYPANEGWTHCYEIRREVPGLAEILTRLERCLILQDLPSELDSAIALDFYKIPRPDVDPRLWLNTDIGELVNKMKYWNDPVVSAIAREDLADRMASLIRDHPIYRSATLVSVPGHDASVTAPSEFLAVSVADRLGTSVVRTRPKSLLRPETKSLKRKVDLRSEYLVPDGNMGYTALVIDDVYERGRNMQGVAAAARAVGAREVHGLVAARTVT